jgi:hypothetical protein
MPLLRIVTLCTAVVLTGGLTALGLAQERADGPGSGSLAALTAEVRQLRLAVEALAKDQIQAAKDQTQAAKEQAQMQALAIALSVQQSRILQLTARLDATRAELERAAGTDLEQRQAASREAELFQMLQVEEARWADLIARLDQVIKQQ